MITATERSTHEEKRGIDTSFVPGVYRASHHLPSSRRCDGRFGLENWKKSSQFIPIFPLDLYAKLTFDTRKRLRSA